MDQSGAFAIDEDPVPEVFCKEYRTLTAMHADGDDERSGSV